MSKRHNGSHAESMPALHRAVHTGLKRAHTSRSTPWKEREGIYLTHRHQQEKKKEKKNTKCYQGRFLWWRHFVNMFAHPFIIAVGTLCLSSTFLGVLRDDPSIRANKGTSGGANVTGAKTNLLFKIGCLSFGGDFYSFFRFNPPSLSTPGPRCHSPALCLKLSRQICIEKPFAYQTAGTQSSHHLSLIYREMHVVLTRWSACPLYLHLPFVGIS